MRRLMRRVSRLADLPGGAALAALPVDQLAGISGAVSWEGPDGQQLMVWGPGLRWETEGDALDNATILPTDATVTIWNHVQVPDTTPGGRTQQALRLLEANPGLRPYAAAKQAGVHVSAVYRALERGRREACPCCGRRMPA